LESLENNCPLSSNIREASINIPLAISKLYIERGNEIKKAFKEWGIETTVKYIDPSYIIRSVPANSDDSIFCADLARAAVNAAMAGKTDMLIGYWHGEFTNVPLKAIHKKKKRITVGSDFWNSVLATTGQPSEWV